MPLGIRHDAVPRRLRSGDEPRIKARDVTACLDMWQDQLACAFGSDGDDQGCPIRGRHLVRVEDFDAVDRLPDFSRIEVIASANSDTLRLQPPEPS